MNDTPDDTDGPRQLELGSYFPYRLATLADTIIRSFAGIFGPRFGITHPEWRIVAALGTLGSMTSTDIGQFARLHKTRVSRTVSELEAKGLLSRRTSEVDMRVAHLSLTARGRSLYDEMVPLALAFDREISADLTAQEREDFLRILDRITARAEGAHRVLGGAG